MPSNDKVIAVPVVGGKLSPHFGHAEEFHLVRVDEGTNKILGTTRVVPPPHEPGVIPNWLASQGAHVVLVGGMGWRAQQIFEHKGVHVVTGAKVGTPLKLVKDYLANQLETGGDVCDHSTEGSDHHHHHHHHHH